MQPEYLSNRELKIPSAAPAALGALLNKTQEGVGSAPSLDTVRWVHDSLAFLAEFFASFSVGALKTVGPHSSAVEALLSQPPSLDRTERLLNQAFLDWKAHPHHPAYESLREAFYLTSRLQSSRTAPRRHTRWLGVGGRAVAGLEQLSRWSRRIDLLVSGGDESTAQEQVHLYLPVLWIWTDALEDFFAHWSLELNSVANDGRLGFSGSAKRDDIHLELLTSESVAALKSRFVVAADGQVTLDGFAPSTNGIGGTAPTPAPVDPVPSTADDIELVYDEKSGNYVVNQPGGDLALPSESTAAGEPKPATEVVDDEPVMPGPDALGEPELPSPEALGEPELPGPEALGEAELPSPEALGEPELPGPEALGEAELLSPEALGEPELPSPEALGEPELPSPEALGEPELLSPEALGEAELPSPEALGEPELLSPEALGEPELPGPDALGESALPGPVAIDEPPTPSGLTSMLSFAYPAESADQPAEPAAPSVDPIAPAEPEAPIVDLSTPDEPAPIVDLTTPDEPAPVPDLSAPAQPEAPIVDLSTPDEPAPVPDLSPPTEPEAPMIVDLSTPDVPAPVPDLGAPVEPEAPIVDLSTPDEPAPVPDLGAPVEPEAPIVDLSTPDEPAPVPDLSAPVEPEAPVVDLSTPDEPAPVPDLSAPVEPEAPVVDLSSADEPAPVPDLSAPVEPEAPVVDLSTPDEPAPVPDLSAPAAPEAPIVDLSPPDEPAVPVPDLSGPPSPDLSAPPDLSTPSEAPLFASENNQGGLDLSGLGSSSSSSLSIDTLGSAPDAAPAPVVPAPQWGSLNLDSLNAEQSSPTLPSGGPQWGSLAVDTIGKGGDEDLPAPAIVTAMDSQWPGIDAFSSSDSTPLFGEPNSPAMEPTVETAAVTGPEAEPTVETSGLLSPEAEPTVETSGLLSPEAEPTVETAAVQTEADEPDSVTESSEVEATDSGPVPSGTEPSAAEPVEPVSELPPAPEPTEPDPGVAELEELASPEPVEPADSADAPLFASSASVPLFSGDDDAPLFTESDDGPLFQIQETQSEPTPAEPEESEPVAPAAPEAAQPKPPSELPEAAQAPPPPPPVPPAESAGPLFATEGDSLFIDSGDGPLFTDDETDAPLFATNEGSVEVPVPVTQAPEMGAKAEDILEDDYEFSAEAGPARPQWSGWSVDEREQVQAVCETMLADGQGQIPAAFERLLSHALASPFSKLQIVLGPGCGKSRLARDLQQSGKDGPLGTSLLVDWHRHGSRTGSDGAALLAVYFHLREQARSQGGVFVVPEPEAVAELAASISAHGFAAAFQRFLGQLSVLNSEGITLLFDEPSESIRAALAAALPAGVRIVSLVPPVNSSPGLGQIVDLQPAWPEVARQLYGEDVTQFVSDPKANLLRVALASQLKSAGVSVSDLDQVGSAVMSASSVSPELLACLALEREFVSLDDLDQWFIPADSVERCVEVFPSLFQLQKTRLAPLLGLSHPSLDAAASEKLSTQRQKSANALLGWVVTQLERTSSDKYGGLQVREIVFRNFCRLYHFARLSGNPQVLEWVARNKDLQRNRVALTSHLEKPANRWDLQELLELLCAVLSDLVATGNCDDLRDEKAWAQSNLALNELHLGLLPEAKANVEAAHEMFNHLVEKERQQEFKPALATTLYRASLIADKFGESESAQTYADQAVQHFIDLVEDRGRVELQPRLGIALAHRGRMGSAGENQDQAMKDLQRASSLLGSVPADRQKEYKRTQIEVQLELANIYLKTGDADSAVKESGKAVQLAVQAVEELQMESLQPLLASCHAHRAKGYLKLNDPDRAQRDVSKSITLRNLAVDEGRLDQRFFLASDHLLRAQVSAQRDQREDSIRDLDGAVRLLTQLAGEGRSDAPEQLLKALLQRAELLLATGESARGVEDLDRASKMVDALPETPETEATKLKVLDALLSAYLKDGQTAQALTVSKELLTTYQAAGDWERYAGVQLVRGRAFDANGDYQSSYEAFNQAVGLITKVLEEGQTVERLRQLAEAYLGIATAELKLERGDRTLENAKRSIDVFTHLFQQHGDQAALPRLLRGYSLHAASHIAAGRVQDSLASLKLGFDVLKYLETQNAAQGLEDERARLHRRRARALLEAGDANSAFQDTEEAIRNFLITRQQNQRGPWKDELARTWTLRSRIFFQLKDFNQAEQSSQEAIAHFDELLKAGKYQYFDDLMAALSVRAENSGRAGKINQVLEEYSRMLATAATAAQAGAPISVESESAKIMERRAQVYRDQSLFNEAYADYERVIGLYRKLVTEGGRGELAPELTRVHLDRGNMVFSAGHAEHAIGDFTEAINVAKALVGQGSREAAKDLALALNQRAECFRHANKPGEALQDLDGAIGFQMQMVQQGGDQSLLPHLGKALLTQGTLRRMYNQLQQAAESFDTAIQIFTQLVEAEQKKQYSGDLAQALISRVSLYGDKSDPSLRNTLIRAVKLVTSRAQEGEPVSKEFTIDCLKTVVELLGKEDFETVGDLIDSLLALIELVVTDGKSTQDFVKLTDLLLAASSGLIDDRRTARRPAFLALACVSCNREIQIFGQNSLPRLVYCLYELGQALERSKPPAALNYIGSSFALLGDLASRQENSEDFVRELKMMVTTWRSLPPQVPALANVSRHMLSQLLRLT